MAKSKKTAYQVIAEAFVFDKLKNLKLPTLRADHRKLGIDEIKQYIAEEYKAAHEAHVNKQKEQGKSWGDAELAKEIDWIKKLDIKEFFDKYQSEIEEE